LLREINRGGLGLIYSILVDTAQADLLKALQVWWLGKRPGSWVVAVLPLCEAYVSSNTRERHHERGNGFGTLTAAPCSCTPALLQIMTAALEAHQPCLFFCKVRPVARREVGCGVGVRELRCGLPVGSLTCLWSLALHVRNTSPLARLLPCSWARTAQA